jgi:hypothetical protein
MHRGVSLAPLTLISEADSMVTTGVSKGLQTKQPRVTNVLIVSVHRIH